MVGVRAFSSTVTYGPFSRDYIQPSDLTRKRGVGSPTNFGRLSARRVLCGEAKRRNVFQPIFFFSEIFATAATASLIKLDVSVRDDGVHLSDVHCTGRLRPAIVQFSVLVREKQL